MATNLLTLNPISVRSSGTTRRISSSRTSCSANWWTPIFGYSSEPDYIDDSAAKQEEQIEAKSVRSKFSPGSFTEEKARRLRKMTTGTEAFHDVMYHSAIASRLASDFSGPSDL